MSTPLHRIGSIEHAGYGTSARRRWQRVAEAAITLLLRACAFLAVAGLLLIVVFVFKEALPILTDPETQKEASLRHFTATALWQPVGNVPKYGMLPLFVGTLKVVLVAMLFAVPVSVMAAVFASEFAPARVPMIAAEPRCMIRAPSPSIQKTCRSGRASAIPIAICEACPIEPTVRNSWPRVPPLRIRYS